MNLAYEHLIDADNPNRGSSSAELFYITYFSHQELTFSKYNPDLFWAKLKTHLNKN